MFGNLFGKKAEASTAAGASRGLGGFRLGGAVVVDALLFKANAGAFGFEPPAGDQPIEALGTVDLGGGTFLYRWYVEDDAWYQVKATAGQVDEIKLFVFADTINPPTVDAFRQWVEPASDLGKPALTFNGRTYSRVWGDGAANAWAPPIVYDESVTHPAGGPADFTMTHYSMLYEREVEGLPGRFEYLFVTAEDYGPNNFDIVYSLGTDVSDADLSLT
ncbi:DUF2491 family protein [Rhodanobacter sp. 7MK24]|uniref:DUF2491 family protein n=1 Tax=Rhodanobacter sp. 7MK24 TaxID=2775922 RepID=UPI0017870A7E|nr:DUF2491 family protein [Rhodanobacter sp. 7MK24]MBD8879829.1 DUF2491 family protein [Rhodanobacter sp. 7MK24]